MFLKGFEKIANATVLGMKPETAKKVYYGMEQGGLGALTALDAHEAYKGYKEGDKSKMTKGVLGATALGGLMAATHLSHKMSH